MIDKKLTIIFKDEDGNVLLSIKDGECLLARFKNLDEKVKENMVELFIDFTDMSKEETIEFLEFKEKEQKFCS